MWHTGLDSFAALNVMEHMSNLADLGHTIIASIHQPRSAIWDMFDKVGLLCLLRDHRNAINTLSSGLH